MWILDEKYVNEPQRESITKLIKRCKQAHFVDVKVRINGEDEWYEIDWLKHLAELKKDKTNE